MAGDIFISQYQRPGGFPGGTSGKELACQRRRRKEMWVRSLGWEDLLEEGVANHSSILAWKIPWTEETGRGLQTIGSQRVRLSMQACTSGVDPGLQGCVMVNILSSFLINFVCGFFFLYVIH